MSTIILRVAGTYDALLKPSFRTPTWTKLHNSHLGMLYAYLEHGFSCFFPFFVYKFRIPFCLYGSERPLLSNQDWRKLCNSKHVAGSSCCFRTSLKPSSVQKKVNILKPTSDSKVSICLLKNAVQAIGLVPNAVDCSESHWDGGVMVWLCHQKECLIFW